MKKLVYAAVLLQATLFCVLIGPAAKAAPNDRANPEGGLGISSTTALNFGRITPSTIAGSVAMTPLGVRAAAGGVTLLNGGAPSAAAFSITGPSLRVYSIVLPPNGAVSLTSGGGSPMAVGGFLSLPALVGTLSLAGQQNLLVGATLSVGASQAGGTYNGLFNVTVAFN